MAKQRFRTIKQSRHQQDHSPIQKESDILHYASSGLKIKAFLTDAFMLLMPIMYIVFYLIMDGREGFAQEKVAGWIYILTPLITVQTLFFYYSGQTPGYRAYHITLIDEKSKKRPTLFIIFCRTLAAVLSFLTFFGWLVMFFRKDHKTLHDLLCATAVVNKE